MDPPAPLLLPTPPQGSDRLVIRMIFFLGHRDTGQFVLTFVANLGGSLVPILKFVRSAILLCPEADASASRTTYVPFNREVKKAGFGS